MAKRILFGAIAAVALVAASSAMAGDIVNGDFEQGDVGWGVASSGAGGNAVFGGGTATVTGPDGAGGGYYEIWQQLGDNPQGGPDKVISFDMVSYSTVDIGYTPAFDSPYISVNGQGWGLNEDGTLVPGLVPGSGLQNGYGNVGEGDGQASNVHYELLIPGGCENDVRLAFGVDSADGLYGPGIATYDNVSSECVPEPTTAVLLLFGAAALIRRR